MIRFNRLTKTVGRKGHRRHMLREVDWTIARRSQIAILGVHPADCTMLLDLISGAQLPTAGWVDRQATVLSASWIGRIASGLITTRELIAKLASVYRVDAEALAAFVAEFAELQDQMAVPIRFLARHMRQRVSLALIYGIPSDFYLFDTRVQLGPPHMKDRCSDAFSARRQEAGVILATSQPKVARNFGGTVVILHEGSLYMPGKPEEAIEAFEQLLLEDRKNQEDRKSIPEEPQDNAGAEPDSFDFVL